MHHVARARVPGVYLSWANPVFLAFFPFNRISNLRAFNVAFSSIPTAPTKSPVESVAFASREPQIYRGILGKAQCWR
jgi:hypothetical protein